VCAIGRIAVHAFEDGPDQIVLLVTNRPYYPVYSENIIDFLT